MRHYLTNRFGLKKLVEQQAWELLEGLTRLQHVRPLTRCRSATSSLALAAPQQVDVELFSSFLEGKYAEPTLLFFLSARMALQVKLQAKATCLARCLTMALSSCRSS